MLKSSKHVDNEREIYLRITNIIVNFGGSAKQSMEILFYLIVYTSWTNVSTETTFW